MKRQYKAIFFALLFLAMIGPTLPGQTAYADGGQITTKGIISFYEETTSEPLTSSSESEKTSSSEPLGIKKPQGRLPSTGEIIKSPFTWIGLLLVGSIVLLFQRTKGKREAEEDN